MRKWLRTLRDETKMTQAQVAEVAGISRQYYSLIEEGERGNPLNVDTAKAIAVALGFDWTRFYEHDGTPDASNMEQPA